MYLSSLFPRMSLACALGTKTAKEVIRADIQLKLNNLALIINNPDLTEAVVYSEDGITVIVNDMTFDSLIRPLAQILLNHHLLPNNISPNILENEIQEFIRAYAAYAAPLAQV